VAGAELSYDKALRLFQLLEPGGALLVGWPDARERVEGVTDRVSRSRAARQ
jgi:hypothetical protein